MADPADVIFHDPASVPGTHALVIGVGQYPHLVDGANPGQITGGELTSPPISARTMATWLRRDYRCPGKPLASLSLLTSEPAPAPFVDPVLGTQTEVVVATVDAIVEAVLAWKKRGDSSEQNRLVFYFCGHGTSQGDDMALLAREFGLDTDNPLRHALDFRKLVDGLNPCAASEQVFFVDACRSGSDVLIGQGDGRFAGQVPLLGRPRLDLPMREAVTYYATLAGARSHARRGETSLFTQAVLRALAGPGSDNPADDEEWWVSTNQLHTAVTHFMKEPVFAGRVATVQVPAVTAMPVFDLHRLSDRPVVPVYVSCLPADDNQSAEFVCRRDGTEHLRRIAGDLDDEDPTGRWLLDLSSGHYEFEARLGPGDVRVLSRDIRPVFRTIDLRRAP